MNESPEALPLSVESANVTTQTVPEHGLRRSLGTWRLILMVVAAAAPMAAVIGIVPVAFALGNGPGVPLTFVCVSIVLAFFSVGYSAMSRRIVSTGAFYSYIAQGLGGAPGLGAAFVAVVSYTVFVAGGYGYVAVFTQTAVQQITGWNGSWIWFAVGGCVAVGVLGYRRIDLSSRLIAVLLTAEFAILLCLVISIIWHAGVHAFPAQSFSPHAAISGTPGIAVMLAFTCFIGFESAALYSEETHDPRRSVARATYGAVALIGAFYVLTTWVTVGAVGPDRIAEAAGQSTGNIYFDLTATYLAPWVADVMAVLMATSLFATTLAIHNVASRYLFALGRQRCLPHQLGRIHHRHGSPSVASCAISIVTTATVLVCVATGVAPMVGLGTVGIGFGTVGIIALQCVTSLAVVGYFRRVGAKAGYATLTAPLLAFIGLFAAVVLAVGKFDLLSGASSRWVNCLPALLAVVFAAGVGHALWIRKKRPTQFRQMTELMANQAPE
ncbi:amino acid permease [Nocardia sp. R6R-6]|uniref:amino acid permease n=1 Tax=Nocardia sp. R6R-6 TaxID=3459303 RepID=UPI00403D6A96